MASNKNSKQGGKKSHRGQESSQRPTSSAEKGSYKQKSTNVEGWNQKHDYAYPTTLESQNSEQNSQYHHYEAHWTTNASTGHQTQTGMLHLPNFKSSMSLTCPYHGQLLSGTGTNFITEPDLGLMPRYLDGHPAEQYALFYRPDTGYLSIHKECTCLQIINGTDASVLEK